MEDKDKIKDLFKDRFETYEVPVDPKLWGSLEAKIELSTKSHWLGNAINSIGYTIVGISLLAVVITTAILINDDKILDNENVVNNTPVIEVVKETVLENKDTSLINDEVNKTFNGNEVKNEEKARNREKGSSEKLNPVLEIKRNLETHENDGVVKETAPGMKMASHNKRNVGVTDVVSIAPEEVVVDDESKVLASPSGGIAPLMVSFSSISDVVEVNWKFDDGTESDVLNPIHEFEKPGIYFVTMLAKLKDGSITMDKAVVEVKERLEETTYREGELSSVFVPNIFTPNGDGENDVFKIESKGIRSFSISIYAVNGKLVYQNEDIGFNWDGRDLTGVRVEDGTYYYLINALGTDEKIYTPKGYLTIRGGN